MYWRIRGISIIISKKEILKKEISGFSEAQPERELMRGKVGRDRDECLQSDGLARRFVGSFDHE